MQACVHCAHANPGGALTCAGCAWPLGFEVTAQAPASRNARPRFGLDPAKLEGRNGLLDSLLLFVAAIRGAWSCSRSHGRDIGWYVLIGALVGCLLTQGLRLLAILAVAAAAGLALLVMQLAS